MAAPTWIAEEQVVFVHPDGRRERGRIAIAMPVQVDQNEAKCAVALDGFDPVPGPIYGGSRTHSASRDPLSRCDAMGIRR